MNRIEYKSERIEHGGSTIILSCDDLIEEYSDYRINQHTLQPIMDCELKVFAPPIKDKIDISSIRDNRFDFK